MVQSSSHNLWARFQCSGLEMVEKHTGFPAAWKIMENLENGKSIFQTWKNHGILN